MLDAQTPADGPAAPQTVLDPACLQQLRGLDPQGGTTFLVRVLETYQRSLERYVSQAEQAGAQADWAGLSQAVHALKSASASVGAQSLSARCARLEDACRRAAPDEARADLPAFFTEASAVRAAVSSVLEGARA